jgi:hypothetical protein
MSLAFRLAVTLVLTTATLSAQAPQAVESNPATGLYRQLRDNKLDPARVYNIRGAALDREGIHLSFADGTIAFTEAIDGHINGAFFEGEGEVLVIPPNQVERHSLALFTGAAVLEEKFTTAYLRFNDETFAELEPLLRPEKGAQEFTSRWDPTVRTLAESSALRLLLTFYNRRESGPNPHDRLLHGRIGGVNLGNFDVFFDTLSEEQISVGRMSYLEGRNYYDLWASFPMRSRRGKGPHAILDPAHDIRQALKIHKYTIRAQVIPPTELQSDTTLDVEFRQPGHRVLFFELSRYLKLNAVEAEGVPLEYIQNEALEGTELARRGNDVVALTFARAPAAGQRMKLRFVYGGSVLQDAGGGLMYVGARGSWYPHRGLAMTNFDLEFRSPSDYSLIATGKRVKESCGATELPSTPVLGCGAGQTKISRWITERPIPLAGFNLGRYVRATATAGKVLIETFATAAMERSFPQSAPVEVVRPPAGMRRSAPIVVSTLPPSPARNAQQVANFSAKAVDFFSRRLGPYPYSSLSMTQMPGRASQGWPGLVFLSSYSFLSPEERRQARIDLQDDLLFERLMPVHEVAHQWWGDLIIWRTYRDQWLVEALANYLALMMLEAERPSELTQLLDHYRRQLVSKAANGGVTKDAGPVTLGLRLSSSKHPLAYETVGYGRGTWLFHMLRHLLRDAQKLSERDRKKRADTTETRANAEEDALFFSLLRKLRADFEGKEISTGDLQYALEEIIPEQLWFEGKRSLDWFFEGWVNGTAIPRLQLSDVKFSGTPGSRVVTGKILQKDVPELLVTSVPLYAETQTGRTLIGRIFADGSETSFRLRVAPGTRKLLLDPLQTVLTQP